MKMTNDHVFGIHLAVVYADKVQGLAEITPTFGGVTARAVEGIQ